MKNETTKNPFGAGRKKNTWPSTRRTVPDALWPEVKKMINEWKKAQVE